MSRNPCSECAQIIQHLNARTGKTYREESEGTRKLVHPRHQETSVDDAKKVIDHLVASWKGDAKMEQYLRPATIFAKSKYHQRLDDISAGHRPSSTQVPPSLGRGTEPRHHAHDDSTPPEMAAWHADWLDLARQYEAEGSAPVHAKRLASREMRRLGRPNPLSGD